MKKREALNRYVKNHYGMELSEFIKQKVEGESLYDYEITHMLHVSSYYVCKLRKALGIQRSDGFSRRFEETYGPDAVERFKKCTMVFKYASKASRVGKKEYFRINNVRSSKIDFDFALLSVMREKENNFFIIPRRYMPKTNTALILGGKPNRGKYAQFKNAWDILTQTSDPDELSQ